MGFLDSINDAINKGASETGRLIEVGKLKTQVGTLNKQRTELMAALPEGSLMQRAAAGLAAAVLRRGVRGLAAPIANNRTAVPISRGGSLTSRERRDRGTTRAAS